MARKTTKRSSSALPYVLYVHKLEEGILGPEYDRKGRWTDLDDLEEHLESQRFGLHQRQECEIIVFENPAEAPDYELPKEKPVARWFMHINKHNEVVLERVET